MAAGKLRLDTHRRWQLVTYLATYFLSISMLYQMSPFFLTYAVQTAGATADQVGVIFAALPFASFLAAIPSGTVVQRLGPKGALTAGLLLLAGSTLGFGLSSSVGGWVFWRLVQGVATAPVYTAVSSSLARTFSGPGEFIIVNGYQEVVANLGFTIGPVFGGSLFQWGGFCTPFAVSAVLHLIFVALSRCVPDGGAGDGDMKADALLDADGEGATDASQHLAASRLCYRKVLIVAGVSALSPGVWGGLEPVLADHFHATLGNISDSVVGVLFAVPAVIGTAAALIIPRFSGVVSDTFIMVVGLVVFAVGLAGFGVPAPGTSGSGVEAMGLAVGSTGQWVLQVTAMAILGCGFQIAWTPCLPSLMDAAAQNVAAETGTTAEVAIHRVSAAAASVFNAAAAIGEASGPILGGLFVRICGFDGMVVRFGVVIFVYAVVMFLEDLVARRANTIQMIPSISTGRSTPLAPPQAQIRLRAAASGGGKRVVRANSLE